MANSKPLTEIAIDPPRLPLFHPNRFTECQDALSGTVSKMIDDAEEAGWTLHEITSAIVELADSIALQEADIEETNYMLKELFRKK
jgi:hypothetical protein